MLVTCRSLLTTRHRVSARMLNAFSPWIIATLLVCSLRLRALTLIILDKYDLPERSLFPCIAHAIIQLYRRKSSPLAS